MWLTKIALFLILLSLPMISYALDVTLEWEANKELEVIGYSIYGRIIPDGKHKAIPEFKHLVDVVGRETTTVTLKDLGDYTWCFVATAFSVDQESIYSNEVCTDDDLEEEEEEEEESNEGSGSTGCFIQVLKGETKICQ